MSYEPWPMAGATSGTRYAVSGHPASPQRHVIVQIADMVRAGDVIAYPTAPATHSPASSATGTVRSLMLALRAILAADGQQPVPSSREQASARARSTRRSLPEVGDFAHTQFITAMLTGPRSRVPGSEARMGAGSTLCPIRAQAGHPRARLRR